MKTITELREELTKVFENLRDGGVEVKAAAEMNNTAGKLINTLKVELDYNVLMKNNKKIKFLEG